MKALSPKPPGKASPDVAAVLLLPDYFTVTMT
jgi:hypothetical protein